MYASLQCMIAIFFSDFDGFHVIYGQELFITRQWLKAYETEIVCIVVFYFQ